jgi:hypothetical protein
MPACATHALRELCPCHVKFNDVRIWERALALADDPIATVSATMLHLLCDGSPRERHTDVMATAARMQRDPDEKLCRRTRKFMAEFRRTGNINVQ